MKVYFFDELISKTNDQLLDLLSDYIKLRNETCDLMKDEPEMKDFYIENHLYFYLLNIAKIKSTLSNKIN
jgi:hypothetical protein